MQCRSFEPIGATQNAAMDGSAKTITLADRVSDVNTAVLITVVGNQTAFVRLDGVTPTTSNAAPLIANSAQVLSMPVGATTVKAIGTAGSTVYVTAGRGL